MGAVVVDGLIKSTLSPTALGAYDVCGRRGQFYQDPDIPKGPPSLGQIIGYAWHTGLETFYLGRKLGVSGDLYTEMADAMWTRFTQETADPEFVLAQGESVETAAETLAVMNGMWMAAAPIVRWEAPGIDVVEVEYEVKADFGSPHHIFHGFLDRVMRVDGLLVGVDDKTAGRSWSGAKAAGDPRAHIQAPLYAEAWERQTATTLDAFCYDVWTHAGKHQRVWVPVGPDYRNPFVERWRETSAQIALHAEAGLPMPTNPSHILCSPKWCNYWDICPMGAALDESDQTKGESQ